MFTNGSSISTEDPKTKRSLIRLYLKVFDPMGLLTPFLMIPKLLFQELWTRGLDWDQSLDSDIAESWEIWKHELANVDQIKVPRWLLRNYLQLTKVNSMDLVMPAKELMVQRSTFVLRTEMATEYPS